jgi:hypothetical protein
VGLQLPQWSIFSGPAQEQAGLKSPSFRNLQLADR